MKRHDFWLYSARSQIAHFWQCILERNEKDEKNARKRPSRPSSTFFESDEVEAQKVRQKAQFVTSLSIIGTFLMVCSFLYGSYSAELEELKLRKRFGVGVSAAGPLSMLGVEADVNLSEEMSISAGVGTGLQYSTFMMKARYFLLGEWVSPYLALGVARWWTDGTKEKKISPSVLENKFLPPGYDLRNGFNFWIMAPTVGVQFMHPIGLAFFAEVQYLFKLFDFSHGTYAGTGVHYYF